MSIIFRDFSYKFDHNRPVIIFFKVKIKLVAMPNIAGKIPYIIRIAKRKIVS